MKKKTTINDFFKKKTKQRDNNSKSLQKKSKTTQKVKKPKKKIQIPKTKIRKVMKKKKKNKRKVIDDSDEDESPIVEEIKQPFLTPPKIEKKTPVKKIENELSTPQKRREALESLLEEENKEMEPISKSISFSPKIDTAKQKVDALNLTMDIMDGFYSDEDEIMEEKKLDGGGEKTEEIVDVPIFQKNNQNLTNKVPQVQLETEENVLVFKEFERGELWVDKYKPTKISEILGNKDTIKVLKIWLDNWESNHSFKKPFGKVSSNNEKYSGFQYNERKLLLDGEKKKSVLISGAPGIGKTTVSRLICELNNYELIELNASDSRSSKTLKETIDHLCNNQTITHFFKGVNQRKTKKRTCIIMDEVDGMSQGDRGGVGELIRIIKKSKLPIICICNDRRSQKLKSLLRHCLDLQFKFAEHEEICFLIKKICLNESFMVPDLYINHVVSSLQRDIRSILNYMQFLSKLPDNEKEKYFKGNSLKDFAKKDVQKNPFTVSKSILMNKSRLNDTIGDYFVDSNLIPLFVQQNYVNIRPPYGHRKPRQKILSDSSDVQSLGDTIELKIRKNQLYKLRVDHAVLSCCLGTYDLKPGSFEKFSSYDYFNFPGSLGKFSSTRKNYGIMKDFNNNSSHVVSTSKIVDILDYLPLFQNNISKKLVENGKEGFDEVYDFMSMYGVNRTNIEEMDDLISLGNKVRLKNDWKSVPKIIKSGFTRFFNKKIEKISKVKGKNRKDYAYSSESDVDNSQKDSFLVEAGFVLDGGTFSAKRKKKKKKRKRKTKNKPRKKQKIK